nr:hypothetical protein [Tanacetum cinerariifolium]
ADLNNLESTFQVSHVPTTRIYKDHPLEQVIGDLQSALQTRRMHNFTTVGFNLMLLKKKQNPRKPRRQDPKETQPSIPLIEGADEALNEENVPTQSNDPPLSRVNILESGEDRLKLKELIEIYTKLQQRVIDLENTKNVQAQEISSLRKRVKRFEKKRRSRTHGIKRLYKGRNIADINADTETTLVNETVKDQGRFNDEEIFDTNVLNDEEMLAEEKAQLIEDENLAWDNVQALIDTYSELATRLQEEEQGELTVEEKSRLFMELMDKRKSILKNLKQKGKEKNR